MKDSVIIISGGMDSVTMLHEYADRIALGVSFDYGSNHNAMEIPFAAEHCAAKGIEHIVINLDFMAKYFESSLLQGADAVPEGAYQESNMKSTVVPFRNGIMLSIACGLAESRGLSRVMMANHFGDHSIYPDCTKAFVDSMSAAMKAGTYEGIEVFAPYTGLSKADIAAAGAALGIDYSRTYSCYRGGNLHCGKCATCLERKQALAQAGIHDTTIYEH